MFNWCKNLETMLINYKWKTVLHHGSARKEIVLFRSTGLAFKKQEFFRGAAEENITREKRERTETAIFGQETGKR